MLTNKIKKTAFTLAEVLVTLMIIGVIAAMTVPTLKKSADMEEYVTGCKKAYSTISNATKMVEMDHGDVKRWGNIDGGDEAIQKMYDYYSEHLNIIKSCPPNTPGCWTQSISLNGDKSGNEYGIGTNTISFTTADGMHWCFDGIGTEGVGVKNAPSGSLGMWVDINGDKKPNQVGSDVFVFVLDPNRGVVPGGTDNKSANCNTSKNGWDCTARVLREGKITY